MRHSSSRWLRGLAEALLIVLVVGGVYAWQSRDMLPANQRELAPHFELVDLEGRAWSPETLRGKPAVIYFFAPWCSVCAASAPQLRWFQRLTHGSIELLFIGQDWENLAQLMDYADRHQVPAPVLAGTSQTARDYRLRGYPTYYVIDADGRIAARDFGFTTAIGLWLRTRFI